MISDRFMKALFIDQLIRKNNTNIAHSVKAHETWPPLPHHATDTKVSSVVNSLILAKFISHSSTG